MGAMDDRLERMLKAGQDSPMLRFTLGGAYLKQGRAVDAVSHLESAVAQDPGYSAAWKLLGRARTEAGDRDGAREAFRRGIEVAREKGDKQAEKEMTVFLRRLEKAKGE
jgi:predicted Zn-dependent protease